MTEDVGQALRWVNIVLGAIAFVWLLLRTSRRWEEYPREVGYLLTALLAFVFALLIVSAERIASETDVNATLFVIFVAKVYLLSVLEITRETKYRTGTRLGGKRDAHQDQNRNIIDPRVEGDRDQ